MKFFAAQRTMDVLILTRRTDFQRGSRLREFAERDLSPFNAIANCKNPFLGGPVTAFIVLLRAVNVGGTGKLPMSELKAMCEAAGFAKVQTYIASGNVVLESEASEAKVKTAIEAKLKAYASKPIGALVRTAAEMAEVLKKNPFPKAAPNRTVAIFLDARPPADALDHATGRRDEEMRLGHREIYVHYGSGMADSRLKIPAASTGTARNINTIAKLAEMAAALR
jgi:uncharacterized protein (DUF1697 family)